jgi:hypothetical protein
MPAERENSQILAPPDKGLIHQMNDFQVITERQRVMTALAALTDHYRALNQEISGRETLQWMLAR